jgi:hypothetical protein
VKAARFRKQNVGENKDWISREKGKKKRPCKYYQPHYQSYLQFVILNINFKAYLLVKQSPANTAKEKPILQMDIELFFYKIVQKQ